MKPRREDVVELEARIVAFFRANPGKMFGMDAISVQHVRCKPGEVRRFGSVFEIVRRRSDVLRFEGNGYVWCGSAEAIKAGKDLEAMA